jgi:hypothetical protein
MINYVSGEDRIVNYRFRTSAKSEIIMTVSGEYLLVVIQDSNDCN